MQIKTQLINSIIMSGNIIDNFDQAGIQKQRKNDRIHQYQLLYTLKK